MSELKAYEAYICSHEFLPEEAPKDCEAIVKSNSRYEKDDWWDNAKGFKCYLKSEADKVIAELKEEIEKQKQLRDMALSSVPNVLKVMKIIQHHKYKRCLAMADACRGNFLVAEHMIEKEPKNLMWHKRHKHYGRWMMLWRCFAEEFNEAK